MALEGEGDPAVVVVRPSASETAGRRRSGVAGHLIELGRRRRGACSSIGIEEGGGGMVGGSAGSMDPLAGGGAGEITLSHRA